jgi:hypothetical protein
MFTSLIPQYQCLFTMISTHFGVETATSTHIVSLLLTSSLCSCRYTLVAVISHMGKNTDHGHYICHVRKNGHWVLFNDEKVRTVVCDFCVVDCCIRLKPRAGGWLVRLHATHCCRGLTTIWNLHHCSSLHAHLVDRLRIWIGAFLTCVLLCVCGRWASAARPRWSTASSTSTAGTTAPAPSPCKHRYGSPRGRLVRARSTAGLRSEVCCEETVVIAGRAIEATFDDCYCRSVGRRCAV